MEPVAAVRADAAGARVSPGEVLRVARQPILDGSLRRVGYELLYRSGGEQAARFSDHREATSAVIVDGILDVGMLDLVGNRLAYLNVSRDFLLAMRPLPLPADRVVLELLEDQCVDDELLSVLSELLAAGFTIALDDFRLTAETAPLLQFARIVKLDILERDPDELARLAQRLRAQRPRLLLLAEKVESREDFERCAVLGFEQFQGYFFARPELVPGRRLPSQGLSALRTMAEINASSDFEQLHHVIIRDAGLSMRLLRYANSAYVSLPRRVGSIHEALAWLGTTTVRRFAMMVALANVHDVPSELLVTALVRARLCQQLSGAPETDSGYAHFTVGLFSVADALSGAPMSRVVQELPLRHDVAAALLERGGELGRLLAAVIAYEQGEFDDDTAPSSLQSRIAGVYRDAVEWADSSLAALA